MNTLVLCLRFVFSWQLAPVVLHSDLNPDGTDWTCSLTADARVLKHKHKFETYSDSSHTVQRLYTAYKEYTVGWCSWCVNHGRTAAAIAPIPSQHSAQEILPTKFPRKCPIRTALIFRCRYQRPYLQQTQNYQGMHISFVYILNLTEDGHGRYVLFFKVTSEIITSWLSVSSFRGCPNRLKHNLERNRCATGDEFQAQFLAFRKMWKSSEML